MMHVNTLLPFLSAFSAALAFPAHDKPLQSRNESSALALLSGYTDDSCDGFPIGNYVLDFEGMGVCEGNGTIAKAINIQKLAPGCVVNAWTNDDCTGVDFPLDQVGCWVDFTVADNDTGVQSVIVTCD